MILSYILILLILHLQTQQLMTSQNRSHIECLTQTFNILMLICLLKIDEKCSRTGSFLYDLLMILDGGLLFGPPCGSIKFLHALMSIDTEYCVHVQWPTGTFYTALRYEYFFTSCRF